MKLSLNKLQTALQFQIKARDEAFAKYEPYKNVFGLEYAKNISNLEPLKDACSNLKVHVEWLEEIIEAVKSGKISSKEEFDADVEKFDGNFIEDKLDPGNPYLRRNKIYTELLREMGFGEMKLGEM